MQKHSLFTVTGSSGIFTRFPFILWPQPAAGTEIQLFNYFSAISIADILYQIRNGDTILIP